APDLTPCDFFLWGYVKDKVYVPRMPTKLQELQERITAAVTDIDGNMLLNVWTELDYRGDVCRVSKCAHIEHSQYVPENCNLAWLYYRPVLKQLEVYFGKDLVILSCGLMTRTTPELAPTFQTSASHWWADV
ncbi:hypothetical protein AVEN_215703-1, partial [Araneus ventricosus]